MRNRSVNRGLYGRHYWRWRRDHCDVLAREIPMILRTEIYATAVLSAVLSTLRLITHFPYHWNSQYDGHGRDAIDSAGGYSLDLKLPTFALDENGR